MGCAGNRLLPVLFTKSVSRKGVSRDVTLLKRLAPFRSMKRIGGVILIGSYIHSNENQCPKNGKGKDTESCVWQDAIIHSSALNEWHTLRRETPKMTRSVCP